MLSCRKAGGGQQEFYKLTLTDIIVSSYTTASGEGLLRAEDEITADDIPSDRVCFAFAKIESEYRAQKQDGSLNNPIKTGYDLSTNTAV